MTMEHSCKGIGTSLFKPAKGKRLIDSFLQKIHHLLYVSCKGLKIPRFTSLRSEWQCPLRWNWREATAIREDLSKGKHLLRIAVASLPMPLLSTVIPNEVRNLIHFKQYLSNKKPTSVIMIRTKLSALRKRHNPGVGTVSFITWIPLLITNNNSIADKTLPWDLYYAPSELKEVVCVMSFLRLTPEVIHNRHAPVPDLFKVLNVLKTWIA